MLASQIFLLDKKLEYKKSFSELSISLKWSGLPAYIHFNMTAKVVLVQVQSLEWPVYFSLDYAKSTITLCSSSLS